MKNNDGFTLVELLAVIAILAILVILSLPNVIKILDESKRNTFIQEVQDVAKNSSEIYIKESLKGKNISEISSDGENKLNLSGEELDYYIKLDSRGNVEYLEVSNDSFCIQTDKNYKDITFDDVKDGKCNHEVVEEDPVLKIKNLPSTSSTLNKTKLKNFVNSNKPDEIIFTISGKDSGSDISNGGEAIYAWMEDKIMYVSAEDANKRITLPADSSSMFSYFKIKKLDVTYLDTSNVESMSWMFNYIGSTYNNFEIIGLNYLNTSKVTDMSGMFSIFAIKNTSITLDLSNFDTSKVTNMVGMFTAFGDEAKEINIIGLDKFIINDDANLANMFMMYGNSVESLNLDLRGWNITKAASLNRIFDSVGSESKTVRIDISTWDTSNIKDDAQGMFSGVCKSSEICELKIKNDGNNDENNIYYNYGRCFIVENGIKRNCGSMAPNGKKFILVD